MEFLDILGQPIEGGDYVAWARTRGGTLALGHAVATDAHTLTWEKGRFRREVQRLQVKLDSNGRTVWLPYEAEKFVVVRKAVPVLEPLATRALRAMQQMAAQGLHNPDCAQVREALGLPWSEAHSVYLALEDLHESGEVGHAVYPLYAYTLTDVGRE